MITAGLILFAYLLGSIPTGLWLGLRWKGVDVRRHGSGNLGATNVFRVLGAGPGAVTLILDILKGFVPVALAKAFSGDLRIEAAVGVAAILGHTLSLFVHFKGGKGVATSAGVFAGLLPVPFLAAACAFATIFALTRYVSAGSIGAAWVLAAVALATHSPAPLTAAAFLVPVFVTWTHRANIRRLANGTELKFGRCGKAA